jgi:hypothetical protein
MEKLSFNLTRVANSIVCALEIPTLQLSVQPLISSSITIFFQIWDAFLPTPAFLVVTSSKPPLTMLMLATLCVVIWKGAQDGPIV